MAPKIIRRLSEAGAWAVSAATMSRIFRVFRAHGFQRLFLVNQLVELTAINWIAMQLAETRNWSSSASWTRPRAWSCFPLPSGRPPHTTLPV